MVKCGHRSVEPVFCKLLNLLALLVGDSNLGAQSASPQPAGPWGLVFSVRLPCDSYGKCQKLARPKRFELLTPRFVV